MIFEYFRWDLAWIFGCSKDFKGVEGSESRGHFANMAESCEGRMGFGGFRGLAGVISSRLAILACCLLGPLVGYKRSFKLVGGLEHFLFFHILGIVIQVIPIDFHIFQRGRSTTNQYNI